MIIIMVISFITLPLKFEFHLFITYQEYHLYKIRYLDPPFTTVKNPKNYTH